MNTKKGQTIQKTCCVCKLCIIFANDFIKKNLLALESQTFGIGNRGQGKSTIIN